MLFLNNSPSSITSLTRFRLESGSNEEEEEETVDPSPSGEEVAPTRSRFDDPDDDDRHEEHRKRSRRHSSSTPASSSSKSALTPPPAAPRPPSPVEEKPRLPNYYPAIQGCRRVDEYKCLNRIEEGTYGVVFRAKDIKTGWTRAE